MSHANLPLAERAAAMRREFDRSFTEPPRQREGVTTDLLAIRLGGQAHALRVADIAGLFTDKPLTRLPSTQAAFLGLAGFRGRALPVFDLRRWLGCPADAPARWGVIAAGHAAAFVFDHFEGHLRSSPHDIAAHESGAVRPHIAGLLRGTGEARRVIDLPSVLDALRQASASRVPPPDPE
jgi:chemotaxis signal transduction protein